MFPDASLQEGGWYTRPTCKSFCETPGENHYPPFQHLVKNVTCYYFNDISNGYKMGRMFHMSILFFFSLSLLRFIVDIIMCLNPKYLDR